MQKQYNPKEIEGKWSKEWENLGIYKFDATGTSPIYSIDTPPPYVSADHLHLGHAMSYIQAEIIVRFQRMLGYNIFYPMGFDDNGLPTERFVEKKYKINKSQISKQEFIALCIEETKKGAQNYRKIWEDLGIGVDWSLVYSTISELPQRIAQRSFIDLYLKGLIYQEESPTFWCTSCRTAIAQADIENEESESSMYYIKFEILKDGDVIIATTRPEMIPACVALYVHPDDERFKYLSGSKALVPIFNMEVPILTSEDIDPQTGTGIIMVCTWGDSEDVKKWKTDKLDTRILVDYSGRLTDIAGEFKGMKLQQARQAIVEKLKRDNILIKKEGIQHFVNVHERCATPVEFITSKQWFIKILDFKEEFLQLGRKIKWYPEFMKERYEHWVLGLKWDWCISRDRYYGVPFPVWYCQECKKIVLPEDKDLPVDPRENTPKDLQCKCGSKNFTGEQQVMDTWMTSSLTPLINCKWMEKDSIIEKIYPMSSRVQAFEIIRTWLFYSIVKSKFHTNSIPWKSAMISGWGLDQHGKKMCKSKGNIIRIDKTIEQYSADAIRWWATGAGLGQNLKHSDTDLKAGLKLTNKLWNVARFIEPIIQDYVDRESINICNFSDKWISAELQNTVDECTKALRECNFSKARIVLEKFFWQKYCDTYLELCKDRVWHPKKYEAKMIISLKYTLYLTIKTMLKLFAPILPFVTEEIYHVLLEKDKTKSIHVTNWPEIKIEHQNEQLVELTPILLDIINKIRHFKSNVCESFGSEISSLNLVTTNHLLHKALADLAGLAKAKSIYINDDSSGDAEYKFKSGKLILAK